MLGRSRIPPPAVSHSARKSTPYVVKYMGSITSYQTGGAGAFVQSMLINPSASLFSSVWFQNSTPASDQAYGVVFHTAHSLLFPNPDAATDNSDNLAPTGFIVMSNPSGTEHDTGYAYFRGMRLEIHNTTPALSRGGTLSLLNGNSCITMVGRTGTNANYVSGATAYLTGSQTLNCPVNMATTPDIVLNYVPTDPDLSSIYDFDSKGNSGGYSGVPNETSVGHTGSQITLIGDYAPFSWNMGWHSTANAEQTFVVEITMFYEAYDCFTSTGATSSTVLRPATGIIPAHALAKSALESRSAKHNLDKGPKMGVVTKGLLGN